MVESNHGKIRFFPGAKGDLSPDARYLLRLTEQAEFLNKMSEELKQMITGLPLDIADKLVIMPAKSGELFSVSIKNALLTLRDRITQEAALRISLAENSFKNASEDGNETSKVQG